MTHGRLIVGDRVRLTNRKSIAHFNAGGMTTVGTISRIVESWERDASRRNAEAPVPLGQRAYFVTFEDRPGEWAYAGSELKAEGVT